MKIQIEQFKNAIAMKIMKFCQAIFTISLIGVLINNNLWELKMILSPPKFEFLALYFIGFN